MKRRYIYSIVALFFAEMVLAQNDAAMLAENCQFQGSRAYLQPGIYTAYQMGIRNNTLSSFHLPDGMAIQVFEDDNYRGRTETFYSSVSCLNSSWNERVSSIKVFWIHDPGNEGNGSSNNLPPQGNNVIFYRDENYSGGARKVNVGNFGSATLGDLAGHISSIYIPYGHSVKVNDKNGQSKLFTTSIPVLGKYRWDDIIESGFIDNNYNGGGNSGPLPPQGDRVIFYTASAYDGQSRDFGSGTFGSGSLGSLASSISSIYIPVGSSVKVYDSRNNTRTFTASVANLAQYNWNDRITSCYISIGSGGSTIPPSGDRVIFYRDAQFKGTAREFEAGGFNSSSLGYLKEQVSSIYIPYGTSLQVFDRNGRTQHFTNSMGSLSMYGWDNKITSGSITSNSGGKQTVDLYTDPNFRGNVTPCSEGRINFVGTNVGVSSIKIPPGFAVVAYQGQNLTGNSRVFTSSVSNLASYFGWDNRIVSLFVYRQ